MSSTNKTPNLGLCQWEPTDPFLREDMNGDFAKIDEAIGKMSRVKLFDVTVTEEVPAVELDFTDIDLAPYGELEIFLDLSTVNVAMRMNGVTSTAYSYSTSLSSNTEDKISVSSGVSRIILARDMFIHYQGGNYYTSRMKKNTFPSLNTLNYFTTTGKNFHTGDRFSVWGVKK